MDQAKYAASGSNPNMAETEEEIRRWNLREVMFEVIAKGLIIFDHLLSPFKNDKRTAAAMMSTMVRNYGTAENLEALQVLRERIAKELGK